MSDRPEVVADPHEIRRRVELARSAGHRVGFVPTMGSLHEGHLSLVRRAAAQCGVVVVSVFVNPTQFAPGEDYDRYPRQLDRDVALVGPAGADIVFAPTAGQMYPAGHSTFVQPPRVARRWEGECRPDHFRGVTTVVLKLFHMVPADVSFFGHKDFQQALVIQRMVADLDVPIEVCVEPTVREPDGLAMSSRNAYLSPNERQRAVGLWKTLELAQQLWAGGMTRADHMLPRLRELLERHVDSIDYIAICEPRELEPCATIADGCVVLIAARVGTTRLIDNHVLTAIGR